MAEERLGASFSIDITQLQAGLRTANKLIRESQSEFKAAAAGMDDWSHSESGLNAKIQSLSNIVNVQREKVRALKSSYQQLIADGLDPASDRAVELRTQINREEAALKTNEAELRKNEAALKDLGNESDQTGGKLSKLGEIGKAAGAAIAAAMAAAGAAVVAITKQAIESYAEYEQLVGGVETLFKTSSDKVLGYAQNAYKTAGLSANQYMETVTSFSASLLQGLGGDTDKAAEIANVAITDMSDNANKMGTDMASIQNAYQGFAKQNYTMLDNLKLGYGGTQAEMARLINDSGVLGNAMKVDAESVKNVSFDKLIEAIHVIQTNMGITGTTAKEASTTIQGSLHSLQGAWANMLTGMADETADIDLLIENLIDSIGTFAENLLPRITVVMNGLIKMVQKLLPQIPPLLQKMLPEFIKGVMNLVNGIVQILPQVVDTLMEVIPMLITALIDMLPTLVSTVATLVVQILNALSEMLPMIVDAIMEVLPLLVQALVDALPQLLQAAITFLMAIVQAIPTIVSALVEALPSIIDTIVNTLIDNLPMVVDGAIQLFMGIIEAIPMIIKAVSQNMPTIISSIVNGLIKGLPELIKAGGELLAGLFKGLLNPSAIWEACKDLFNGILGGIKALFGIQSPSKVMERIVGKNLALGIGEGFEDNIGKVNDEIEKAMDFEYSPARIRINRQQGTGGAETGDGVRSVTVNQYNTYSQEHSRYELYKTKQQTAAAVRLAMAGV